MIANAIEDNKIRNLRQSALLECQKKCDRNIKNNNLKILEKIG